MASSSVREGRAFDFFYHTRRGILDIFRQVQLLSKVPTGLLLCWCKVHTLDATPL